MRKKHKLYYILFILLLFAGFWFILPDPLFKDPNSTLLLDRNGELLGARTADDGQWRFPSPDSIPYKFSKCLIHYEDRYFYKHPGINPVSLVRSLGQNIRARKIVSGGSTITMQVIRLSRKGKPRTIWQKIIEMTLAVRLEISFSKDEILSLYATHAPFGGNIVGLETASWRYFGRDPSSLSWAESAMLAVLPNSPSLIHPAKNREALLRKRNFLLNKLFSEKIIDKSTYTTALLEELPEKPFPIRQLTPHLLDRLNQLRKGERIRTCIDISLQEKVNRILEIHSGQLYANKIHGAACIVQKVSNAEVLAYYGNIKNSSHPEYGGDVDVITSPRSTGSILKPILFAEMMYRGDLLPRTLIPDIPTYYKGFSPKNYNRGFDGAVPAKYALARSLNVPSVRMLNMYGVERFYQDLKKLGVSYLKYPSSHYGLSLILGGSEASLWELSGIYSSFARILNNYLQSGGKYFTDDIRAPQLTTSTGNLDHEKELEQGIIGAGSLWLMFESLIEVNRPEQEAGWEYFTSSRKIAWKTGTSFGFRDAWAIGITPEYTVAVWTGNTDGEGRPGLSGLTTSSPILFEVFNLLPQTTWFGIPFDDLSYVTICKRSGFLAGPDCPETDTILIAPAGKQTPVCPYHKIIHLDSTEKFRVTSNCYPVDKMIHKSWFILPPAQEWYFRQKNVWYKPIPPFYQDCESEDDIPHMQLLYPEPGTRMYIPYELDGQRGRLVCVAAHRKPESIIFWHLDNKYLGETKNIHQMAILPDEGNHILILTDMKGNTIKSNFQTLEKD